MPGGGITERDIARIIRLTGADEFHLTASVTTDSPARHRNPVPFMGGVLHRPEYQRTHTSPQRVARVLAAAGTDTS